MTALNGKAVDLLRLKAELQAAGITVPALGIADDDLHTYDAAGNVVAMPAGTAAVINAHVSPVPLDYGVNAEDLDRTKVQGYITTSNAYLGRGASNTPAQVRDQVDRNTKALLTLIKLVRGIN